MTLGAVRLAERQALVPGHCCSVDPDLSGGLVYSVASLGGLEAMRTIIAVGVNEAGLHAVAGIIDAYPYLGFTPMRREWIASIFALYKVCSGVVYLTWRGSRALFPYSALCRAYSTPWRPVYVESAKLWLVGVTAKRRGAERIGKVSEILRGRSVVYYRSLGLLPSDRVLVGRSTSQGPRQDNEDSHHVGLAASCGLGSFAYKICIVADGAGGVGYGKEASSRGVMFSFAKLVDLLFSGLEPLEAMREAALEANRSVLSFMGETGRRAASTLAMCLAPVDGGKLYYLNIGDTAIHMVDSKGVRMLSAKHRVEYSGREVLSSYLGHENPEIASGSLELEEPAYVILSTDGVYEVLGEEVLARIVLEAGDPARAARRLVEEAERRGSRDNMTAVVAYIPGRRMVKTVRGQGAEAG